MVAAAAQIKAFKWPNAGILYLAGELPLAHAAHTTQL
jgi:hypothetical protein